MIIGKLGVSGVGQMPEAFGPADTLPAVFESNKTVFMQPSQHLADRYGSNAKPVTEGRSRLRSGHFQRIKHAICRAILHGHKIARKI